MRKTITGIAAVGMLIGGVAACGSRLDSKPSAATEQAWLNNADTAIGNDTALNDSATTCDEVQTEFLPIFDLPAPPYDAKDWNSAISSLHQAVTDCNNGDIGSVGTDSSNAVTSIQTFVANTQKAYPGLDGLTDTSTL